MIHMFFTKSISSVITLKSDMSVRHWHFGDRNRPEFCFRIWSKCIVPVIGYILQKENHIFLISGKTYSKNFLGVFFLHVLCFLPNFHSDVDTITHHDKYTHSQGGRGGVIYILLIMSTLVSFFIIAVNSNHLSLQQWYQVVKPLSLWWDNHETPKEVIEVVYVLPC